MKVEIIRDYGRWFAKDDEGLATGYGGTLTSAVMTWAEHWADAMAAKEACMREHAQIQRLDASVA